MKDYISVFDGVLPVSICDQLITKFEKNEAHEQEHTDWQNRHFKEVNVSKHTHWAQEQEVLTNVVQNLVRVYMDTHGILLDSQWPRTFGYEQFRLKRYLPNGRDEFAFHTDVGSHASARRFLSFLFYLNSVPEGGKTVFAYAPNDAPFYTVTPKPGSVLVFPPLWMYPHWGEKVIGGPKYILSTYLHYL